MRKQWFGDNRDYVKWSCIRQQAGEKYHVISAVMLRPDSQNVEFLDDAVVQFFEKHKSFSSLEDLFPGRFQAVDEPYEIKNADSYFERLTRVIRTAQMRGRVLVFLDPDTGMEPAKSDDKHVRAKDIQGVCKALMPGDKVVIYQHALRDSGWIQVFFERLKMIANKTECEIGEPFRAPRAKDVCFFTLTKKT
jgi:hypothetical protein